MEGAAPPSALRGVRVLDLGTGSAGPLAATLLGDFGRTWSRSSPRPPIESLTASRVVVRGGRLSLPAFFAYR
jgi:hypothetical protein